MAQQQEKPRDNFRDQLALAGAGTGQSRLAHQSLGRAMSDDERALAEALMEIYASGVDEPATVARHLAERGVVIPDEGHAGWTESILAAVLARLNESLDAAYLENGYGA